jgi:hypothetical protein
VEAAYFFSEQNRRDVRFWGIDVPVLLVSIPLSRVKSYKIHMFLIHTYPYAPSMQYLPTFTIIYPINEPNVGKYTIHGASGICVEKSNKATGANDDHCKTQIQCFLGPMLNPKPRTIQNLNLQDSIPVKLKYTFMKKYHSSSSMVHEWTP